jgi:hypothetical protein
MGNTNELRLMFLSVSEFDSGNAIRGAFLTTDGLTKPLEFRCTTPIRPTPLQKILYGEALREHILVELIAFPLYQAAREKPAMLLVAEKTFLPLRKRLEIPVLWVGKHADSANVLPQEAKADDYIVTSPSGSFEPIFVTAHRDFLSELAEARKKLADVMAERDLLEPFQRLAVALDHIHKQKVGEKDS